MMMTAGWTWRLGGLLALALAGAACGSSEHAAQAVCGDGALATGEQCDDGNTTSGDGCSATCQAEVANTCGDGSVAGGEQCDDGNTTGGDGCSATCQIEVVNPCGDGALGMGEECDDGNTGSSDGCSATCTVEPGYVCSGQPSTCVARDGSCTAPFEIALTDNGGTLQGTGSGDTTGGADQVAEATCDGFSSGAGPDQIWQFTLTDTRDVSIEIAGTSAYDTVLRVMSAPCDVATELPEHRGEDGCSDYVGTSEFLGYAALPPGTYYVVIDGYTSGELGAYSFTVTAAPTLCGNGTVDPLELCDDGGTATGDGCDARCDVEPGFSCTGSPSVCSPSCGNGTLDLGEECDDGNTMAGDRCSATCTLEYDVAEVEPNDTTAQALADGSHIIRGDLAGGDVDLYTFTLTAPATVELETYDAMDNDPTDYTGVGTLDMVDCFDNDTVIHLFDGAGDPTMDDTAVFSDDDDGDASCSYLGPNDSADGGSANPLEGVLQPGTYTIKVTPYSDVADATHYILDLKITPAAAPAAGDLVLNEYMAADNASDTNCDGDATGTADEFVELVNVSTQYLDLTGVTIADSVTTRHTFAAGATGRVGLLPGEAIVVWGGGTPMCAGVTSFFVASSGQLGLNDGGDTITVATGGATPTTLIDVTYAGATLNVSSNLSPELTGATYVDHNTLTGAVGDYSPGTRADGTAF